MNLLLLETRIATLEALLVSIPETLGLLVFGLILIAAAALLRKFLSKGVEHEVEKKVGKEA